jgi:hypothetical protein
MKFRSEFDDYPACLMPVLPTGFIDTSWHNDACPSFTHEAARLVLWVDYPNPADREVQGGSRFLLCTMKDDGGSGDVIAAAEHWTDMEAEIRCRLRKS